MGRWEQNRGDHGVMRKQNLLGIRNYDRKERAVLIFTWLIIIAEMLYFILPMIILGDRYVFTIHDGLDSSAAVAEMIHKNGLAFHFNRPMPVMNGIPGNYFYGYTFYELLGGVFGYRMQQIINRIIGSVLGFACMALLLNKLFHVRKTSSRCLLWLLSLAYAVMPIAPNRTIAFAALPLVFYSFLDLSTGDFNLKKCLMTTIFPFLSSFPSVMIFVLGIWFAATAVLSLKNKRINGNLSVSFLLMSIATVLFNNNLIWIALHAGETNRSLFAKGLLNNGFSLKDFKEYLLHGQYHAPTLASYIIMPAVLTSIIWCLIRRLKKNERSQGLGWLLTGVIFWISSAFLMAFQEAGFKTGIIFVDGVSWGRITAWTRIVWILMFAFVIFKLDIMDSEKADFKFNRTQSILGIVSGGLVVFILFLCFADSGFPDIDTYYLSPWLGHVLEGARWASLAAFCLFLFSENKSCTTIAIYSVMIVHLIYTAAAGLTYGDTSSSVWFALNDAHADSTITMGEFFSQEQFEKIKEDMDYQGEGVAAYGFHPSVLMYNGYNTIDGYLTVHPMANQISFRRIIAPALEIYPQWKSYYDNWGGRMYLYGTLSYVPTINKNIGPEPLYIDTSEFKKYGGEYIFSRAEISNADRLGLSLIKDYDSEDSIYHIYLYRAD